MAKQKIKVIREEMLRVASNVAQEKNINQDEVFEAIAQMTPLQKVTTVQDLADAVTFFASDASRAITGQNLTVDGGLTFN